MTYCPACGEKLIKRSHCFQCSVCMKTHYVNPKAAVATVLYTEDKKQLLFAVRAHEPKKGYLDCVGGFLDVDENFEDAMRRELYEESGMTQDDITDMSYLGSAYDAYEWEGTDVPVTSAYFMACIKNGITYKASDDVEDLVLVTISELDYERFAWHGMRKMLERAVQLLEVK